MNENNDLIKLINRLKSIGIKITVAANYPWIYITKINGKIVVDKYKSEHGFTIAYYAKSGVSLVGTKRIFKLIRKYLNDGKNSKNKKRT